MKRLVVLLFGFAASCGTATPGRVSPDSDPATRPVELRSPEVFEGDFTWRQRVTVRYADQPSRSFDAVLEKKGPQLSLVGLTPINTVTFVVEQRGLDVRFDNRTGRDLPFDGRHILQDVQRVFFPWLLGAEHAGVREGQVLGEYVTEQVRAGSVVQRRFDRPGMKSVVVTLDGVRDGVDPPARAVLDNERYGYRLIIETAKSDDD